MLILIAIICFVIAVAVGSWRQMCGIYEAKMPYNVPSAWHNNFIRIGSWIFVAVLSLIFALIISVWIKNSIGEFIGKFSFGVLLVTRWFFSMFIGGFPAVKKVDEFERKYMDEK
jgi:hypothetical protein